jgi:hypothetical protein
MMRRHPISSWTGVRGRTSTAVLTVVLVLTACGGDDASGGDGGPGSDGGPIEGVEIERVGPYQHIVADIDYPNPAPSGGDHLPSPGWLNCGVYEGAVPDELAVHSLEHGAVWIALGPDSTDDDRAAAVELAARRPGRTFVSDVPDLPDPVELVAWEHRLRLQSADDERAARFVDQFVDASGATESGSACSGGFGEPPTPPPLPVG